MKTRILQAVAVGMALMAAAGAARATLLTESWSGSEAIPEGNLTGIANSLSVSDPGGASIQDVSVNLDISGGYNGGLYGYLVFQPTGGGTAPMEVLLNQVGTSGGNPLGDPGSGFNVTLSDSGTADIHSITGTTGVQTVGTYTPDSANTLDGTFAGGSADGTWTLFLADVSAGGGTSTLTSWSVNVSVVPEPVTVALAVFAMLALALAAVRTYRNRGTCRGAMPRF